ncbi:hypothetical protein PIB30_051935 [Stylosanthes scabra]|uniref:Ribosomal protein S4 n=1 Tax=Stylosanthes scabra TaxID=79078 RepID=A0ABU6UHG7_9FABA|nr:hypothetical protein [Stylosanthes scabra]
MKGTKTKQKRLDIIIKRGSQSIKIPGIIRPKINKREVRIRDMHIRDKMGKLTKIGPRIKPNRLRQGVNVPSESFSKVITRTNNTFPAKGCIGGKLETHFASLVKESPLPTSKVPMNVINDLISNRSINSSMTQVYSKIFTQVLGKTNTRNSYKNLSSSRRNILRAESFGLVTINLHPGSFAKRIKDLHHQRYLIPGGFAKEEKIISKHKMRYSRATP